MMKTTDKFVNDVIEGFQKTKGNGYVYCFPPLTYIEAVKEVYNRFKNKHPNGTVFIVVDTYDTRCRISDFIKENDVTCLSDSYINVRYRYQYDLTIFINVYSDITINHIRSPFKLIILTRDNMNNDFKEFLNYKFKQIVTSVSANAARTDLIYSPVEETQVSVDLFSNDRKVYDEKDNFIIDCMRIFGDLDTIDKCRNGDIANNISAISYRDMIARQNGWSDDLDMNVEYLREIDKYYNPNSLLDRTISFYRIRAEREQMVLNYEVKIDKILDIVKDNLDKKIIIVSKTGIFANKISEVINNTFGYISDCYHNEIEDRIATDENGVAVRYKSGANKGKVRIIKSKAISTLTNKLYNDNKINILSIKNASDVELDVNCDIMIITSPLCDGIFELKTRYKNLRFTGIPNNVYMIYCSSTIESKKLFERKILPNMKIITDTEKNYNYDENSGSIIL